jgi:3',5'-cyclic AMP phosphodiesterase CpdA
VTRDAIHDAELYTVGPDEVVVTFRTDDEREVVTRVDGRAVTTRGRYHVARVTELEPACEYTLRVEGAEPSPLLPDQVTTLPRPPGRLVATLATVNDVHFGETECGRLGTPEELGPVLTTPPGETPYWAVMNGAAIDELAALRADAVLVKGDLTNLGTESEYALFTEAYGGLDRLHHVRGNHDAMVTESIAPGHFAVELEGVTLAVLDTVRPGIDRGRVPAEQLAWLDELAAATTGPVLAFGHHHPWDPGSHTRSETYFGINPDDSEALCAVIARRENIAGYFAGHTHRNRVRRFPQARGVPIVEVACVKDYPGAWAEYRVHEGGYVQVGRRIARPDAMAWTDTTRQMFAGLYRDYALGSIADRCFTQQF